MRGEEKGEVGRGRRERERDTRLQFTMFIVSHNTLSSLCCCPPQNLEHVLLRGIKQERREEGEKRERRGREEGEKRERERGER